MIKLNFFIRKYRIKILNLVYIYIKNNIKNINLLLLYINKKFIKFFKS